jgi:molecular chaperone HscA
MSGLIQIYEPGESPLPHADVQAVGIDLGTTHSVLAVASNGVAEAIHDAEGYAIIPSVVHYGENYNTVGADAREAMAEGEANVIGSIKRHMSNPGYRVEAQGKTLSPIDVSADILKHLRRMGEEALGRDVIRAVITVPAYFDDAARNATKAAAERAGFQVLRLINEPTAAALAYGLQTQAQGIFAIYDFGGGTFDISILKLEDGVFQVLSTAGDTHLGGDDIDHAIAVYALEQLGIKESDLDTVEQNKVRALARLKKEKLTTEDEVSLRLRGGEVVLTRPLIERLAQPFIKRTLLACEQALMDAKLTPGAIGGVVMVGGSTRMPLVKQLVGEYFGSKPLDEHDPDLVVAYGAAVQAEALTVGADTLLLDVTPLSLGLETYGGITEKIIYRNTPIPVAIAQEFTTYQDGQTAMKIHVLQGEREKVEHNRTLAKFELRGIPPMVAGAARINVTFSLDADGLLTVSAKEVTTGVEQQVIVTPATGLEFSDIERMLEEGNANARSDIIERLLIESRVAAERAIQEVESAVKADAALLKPGEEAMVAAQIATVKKAIAGDNRERIDQEVHHMNALVGPFAERRMNAVIADALSGKKIDDVK